MKKTILIFLNRYLPGYKAGGPIQTIANMVEAIGDRYDLKIVTTDRDSSDTIPYPGVKHGEWMQVGKAQVRYLESSEMNFQNYRKILNDNDFSLVYCQSFFNPKFTFLPLLALLSSSRRKTPVLLAPRGEFGHGALAHKAAKKKFFLLFYKLFFSKLLNCTFHCSSEDEAENTKAVLGTGIRCSCAMDFNAQEHIPEQDISIPAGQTLRLAFLGRIDVQKNIDYALKVLQNIKASVQFDIYGNTCDPVYAEQCRKTASELPQHISVSFKGTLPHPEVLKTLASYDLFFFPSKNENFGHVIHEALRAGLPVLVSDQTPWHELDKRNAGWECPLDKPELFAEKINGYAGLAAEARLTMHRAALQYGIDVSKDQRIADDNIMMFENILQRDAEK